MRFTSLQGLRGVAAVTVAVSHFLAIFYLTGLDIGTVLESIRPISNISGILAHKAVWVFFVLSGFVLTHQLSLKHYKYGSYLISRLARLYLPVLAAVILSFGTMAILLANQIKIDFWIGTNPYNLNVIDFIREFTLTPDSYFLGPLWSLKWEVVFSFLAFSAWKLRIIERYPIYSVITCLILSSVGQAIQSSWLLYLPMFIIGVALHKKLVVKDETKTIGSKAEIAILTASGFIPIFFYIASNTLGGHERIPYILDVAASLTAISLLFLVLIRGSLIRLILESKPIQFVGKISFSLYLVHSPILLVVAYVSGFSVFWVLVAFLLVFPLSHLSYKFVEEPSMKLSRRFRSS